MRSVVLLLALAAVAGCRLESRAPAPESSAVPTAEAPAPLPTRPPPPGTQPPPPPDALTNPAARDGRPEVVLYVTEWCPYCRQARDYMAAEGVPHRVVDIEKDPAGAREYRARGGTGGIPLVAVGTESIEGWSEAVAREMLAEAGYE